MILRLSKLPGLAAPLEGYGGKVPARMLFLAPDAAKSLVEVERDCGGMVYTDVYRDAVGSRAARRAKMRANGTSPVQRAAFSPHNYGLAVDIDIDETLKKLKISYASLLAYLGKFGWHCHRRDARGSDSECWHFNFLGPMARLYLAKASATNHATWSEPVEARIVERHNFQLDARGVQLALARLNFYKGVMDGVLGAVSKEAIKNFQYEWDIIEAGVGDITRRTLVYLTAEVQVDYALSPAV